LKAASWIWFSGGTRRSHAEEGAQRSRLFYVAMTRSQKFLFLTYAPIPGKNNRYAKKSVFCDDVLVSKQVKRTLPELICSQTNRTAAQSGYSKRRTFLQRPQRISTVKHRKVAETRWQPEPMPLSCYFVYLKGSYELFSRRVLAHKGHFAKQDLLASQFATLEEPTDAIVVDASRSPQEIVPEICKQLGFA
jgi:ATP-dependent exoDNAse (exonuclease V) beta subunit